MKIDLEHIGRDRDREGLCWVVAGQSGEGFEGRIYRSEALHVGKGLDVPMWGLSFRRLICETEADV